MTEADRDRIRAKQDKLIALAINQNIDLELQISANHPGSPKLNQLIPCIHPEWESVIDWAIRYIEEGSY